MSSPSSWPAPSGQPPAPLQQAPVGYGPGYGGVPMVPPPPPKPERPLAPGVWWSLAYTAIVTVLWALAVFLLGALMWTLITGMSGQDSSSWEDVFGESGGVVAAIAVGSFVVALLVQWGLTVLCLVLWRLLRGFRTLHPAVQALLALLTSWVVGTILSFVLQIFGVFANIAQTGTTSF